MATIRQQINGKLKNVGDQAVFWLDGRSEPVYFCYTLMVRESDVELYPESLLDDWGHEIKSLDLYEWIQDNGHMFPRAEIFGFDKVGKRRQYFLRELDLMASYPSYAFESAQSPITNGVKVTAIFVPSPHITQPKRINCPPEIEEPMRNALVSWWQVPADSEASVDLQAIVSTED
jgi:hypothetical protein